MLVLGIDGGGTKTRCLAADEHGRILGEGLGGPSNYQVVGAETAAANVRLAAQQALQAAGGSWDQVSAICAGLAGVGRPEDLAIMESALDLSRLILLTDGRVAVAGALKGQPGVVVISGTGSIAYGVDAAGRTVRAGGWGWILGDEGSGFAIGRDAAVAALAALDGTGPATALGRLISQEWQLERLEQLVRRVYGDLPKARLDLAALVPVVIGAASQGDEVAVSILAKAGHDLAGLAAAALRRLSLPDDAPALVAVTGGVLTGCAFVRDAFASALAVRAPEAVLAESGESPAEGAVRLALTQR